MNKCDKYFLEIVKELLSSKYNTFGQEVRPKYEDGTPAHTQLITNKVFEYDLSKGEFPFLLIRPQNWQAVIKEMLWMWQDQSNSIEVLENKYGVKWWKPWDIGDGTIGQRYGATLKKYNIVNFLLNELRFNPNNRRLVVNMFQYEDLASGPGLFPCVYETIWNVRGEFLDVIVMQRSSDFVVSWCLDEIQYSGLLMMISQSVGLKPGKLTHVVGNLHLYDRHIEQAKELLKRNLELIYKMDCPKLVLNPNKTNFYDFTIDDFSVENYDPIKPNLKFELAI